jgi:cytidylate kinase
MASESRRYEALYGVNYTDEKQYDLIVDTTKHNLVQVTNIIVEAYKKWLR